MAKVRLSLHTEEVVRCHTMRFTGESVSMIAKRLKTQTRRLINPKSRIAPPERGELIAVSEAISFITLGGTSGSGFDRTVQIRYEATGTCRWVTVPDRIKPPDDFGRYRGRVIPREWSRLFLEVVSVRTEPLSDISPKDAIAEGMARQDVLRGGRIRSRYGGLDWPEEALRISPVDAYLGLWSELHGRPGTRVEDDPIVRVIEFGIRERIV